MHLYRTATLTFIVRRPSSVFRLLFRFYDPTSGEIFLDGQSTANLQIESVREHIAIVPQDTVLFNDTVGYNIRYGKLDATQAEVEEAAKKAALHEVCLVQIFHQPAFYT